MKHIEEYLENVIKIKPLGQLSTRKDIINDMSGEMIYIDGKCSDIFISHADYANWLESKDKQNPTEWRVEDELNLNACLNYIPDEFLKKWLTDIIHVKHDKIAWNKEDEKIYQSIIDDTTQENQLDNKQINWLKSLKQRYIWKPSYYQLEALWCAAEQYLESDNTNVVELRGKVLESLYNELKKQY